MAKNQALSATSLKDVLFTEKEITRSAERENIFEIKDMEEKSLGFISSFHLKTYILEHGEDSVDYSVKNIDSNEWVSIFTHPSFQRRKPQLVTPVALDPDSDQDYYILINGQKNGPYVKAELINMLEQKEILLTDMVSTNGGHTWAKLFHIDNFERRVLKESDQLPGIPNQAVEGNSDSVATTIPSTEAITNLAYLSNVKREKSLEKDRLDSYNADSKNQKKLNGIHKLLLVVSFLSIVFFAFQIKKQLISPFKKTQKMVGEQAEMLIPVDMNATKPVESAAPTKIKPNSIPVNEMKKIGERKNLDRINDTQRNKRKFESRELKPIVPTNKKSFMDTSEYQNIQVGETQDDPNYFYDNSSAMELDPVRSQVSKENYEDSTLEVDAPIPARDNLFDNEIPSAPPN